MNLLHSKYHFFIFIQFSIQNLWYQTEINIGLYVTACVKERMPLSWFHFHFFVWNDSISNRHYLCVCDVDGDGGLYLIWFLDQSTRSTKKKWDHSEIIALKLFFCTGEWFQWNGFIQKFYIYIFSHFDDLFFVAIHIRGFFFLSVADDDEN